MELDEYNVDATELLETYGLFPISCMVAKVTHACPDFLMKYIIIGRSVTYFPTIPS